MNEECLECGRALCAHPLHQSEREKERDKERERGRRREGERKREIEKEGERERCRICPELLFLFLKGTF